MVYGSWWDLVLEWSLVVGVILVFEWFLVVGEIYFLNGLY